MTIDTSNTFAVAPAGDGSDRIHVVLHHLLSLRGGLLTRDESLTLAAWLVALADPIEAGTISRGDTRFQRILNEVLST